MAPDKRKNKFGKPASDAALLKLVRKFLKETYGMKRVKLPKEKFIQIHQLDNTLYLVTIVGKEYPGLYQICYVKNQSTVEMNALLQETPA